MKKASLLLLLTVGLVTTFQQTLIAQDTTNAKRVFKNTVHFNITNPIIFGGRSLIFGYQRVLNKRRAFSINIGQANFPTLNIIPADSIKGTSLRDQKGFHVSGDYRFYLAKENKYDAPRGVYIGPYFSYNYYEKEHSWNVQTTTGGTANVESNTNFTVSTLGVEMGYQFVFWNRLSVDMILAGPGIAAYKLEARLGTNLSEADRQKLFDKLNEALEDKFPGYNVAVDEGEFKKEGSTNTTTFGFRYLIQIGFRF